MTDFDRYAGPAIREHEARKCSRCDGAVDVIFAIVLGVFGALALAHSCGLLMQ